MLCCDVVTDCGLADLVLLETVADLGTVPENRCSENTGQMVIPISTAINPIVIHAKLAVMPIMTRPRHTTPVSEMPLPTPVKTRLAIRGVEVSLGMQSDETLTITQALAAPENSRKASQASY